MKITRRTFIKLSGATLSAIGFLYPGIQSLASNIASDHSQDSIASDPIPASGRYQMTGLDPSYAGGSVIEKTSKGVILEADTRVRAVRIPVDTVVWKEFDSKPDVIELGGWLDVKGASLTDGSLLAQSGWVFVNIGRREGIVEDLPISGIVIRYAEGTQHIELSSRLEIIRAEDGTLLAAGIAALKQGTPIGMVGLRLPNGGFRATRIWMA